MSARNVKTWQGISGAVLQADFSTLAEADNASRQLSAAPELLAALCSLVNGSVTLSSKSSALYSKGDFNGYLSEHCPKVIAARAAIAKAKGEA